MTPAERVLAIGDLLATYAVEQERTRQSPFLLLERFGGTAPACFLSETAISETVKGSAGSLKAVEQHV